MLHPSAAIAGQRMSVIDPETNTTSSPRLVLPEARRHLAVKTISAFAIQALGDRPHPGRDSWRNSE